MVIMGKKRDRAAKAALLMESVRQQSASVASAPSTTQPNPLPAGMEPPGAPPLINQPLGSPSAAATGSGSSIYNIVKSARLKDRPRPPGAPSPTKKRGVCSGKKSEYIVAHTGNKIELVFSPELNGPTVQGINSMVSHDIGGCIRKIVAMNARTFHDIQTPEQWKVWNAMSHKYVWDRNHKPTFDWIMEMSQSRYKEWKYQCHVHYQEGGPANMLSDFVGRDGQWAWLCNHFESPEFKRLSEANKRNRKEKTVHHQTGSCPIAYVMEDLRKKGEVLPVIKGYEKAYVRPGDEFTNGKFNRMIAEIDKRKENFKEKHPDVTEEQIMEHGQSQQIDVMIDVLEPRKGKEKRGWEEEEIISVHQVQHNVVVLLEWMSSNFKSLKSVMSER